MDVSFKAAKVNTVFASSIVEDYQSTYIANNPNTLFLVNDVVSQTRTVLKVLKSVKSNIDIVFGQPFSVKKDTLTSFLMFSNFLNTVKYSKAKMFLMSIPKDILALIDMDISKKIRKIRLFK